MCVLIHIGYLEYLCYFLMEVYNLSHFYFIIYILGHIVLFHHLSYLVEHIVVNCFGDLQVEFERTKQK